MNSSIDFKIEELKNITNKPNNIFYKGNLQLLNKAKISIVGTRKPFNYTQLLTHQLAQNVIYKNIFKYTRINLNGL